MERVEILEFLDKSDLIALARKLESEIFALRQEIVSLDNVIASQGNEITALKKQLSESVPKSDIPTLKLRNGEKPPRDFKSWTDFLANYSNRLADFIRRNKLNARLISKRLQKDGFFDDEWHLAKDASFPEWAMNMIKEEMKLM